MVPWPPFGLQEVKTQARAQSSQHPMKESGLGGGMGAEYVLPGAPNNLKPFSPSECGGRGRAPSAFLSCPQPVIFCLWDRPWAPRVAGINVLTAMSDPSSEGAGGRTSAGSHAKGGEENHIYWIGISLNGALS